MIGKLHIKVCGIKSPLNRESLEELPIDYLGFNFYKESPRYMGDLDETDLQKLLSTTKYRTAIFVNAQVDKVISTALGLNLTHIQLHGSETPGECEKIRKKGLKVIRSFAVHPEFDFSLCRDFADVSDLFLFDTRGKWPGGTGEKFNWNILGKYELEVPFFLSGGISPGDEEVISGFGHPSFYGVDLNSGFEDLPGIKNLRKLQSFLENLDKHKIMD
jgi:phosphoribosylanthranilate isomerase